MPYAGKRKRVTKAKFNPAKYKGIGFRRKTSLKLVNRALRGVSRLNAMIETKESLQTVADNTNLGHNTAVVLLDPMNMTQGTGDSMVGNANRIGDRISIKGLMIKGFIENAAQRPKVYYRVMLTRSAKGDTINRTTLFKGDSGNKMIDQVDTERFTIIAQKVFNIEESNPAWNTISTTGIVSSGLSAGIGTRTFKMWIPGRKFGKYGTVQFENNSNQPKFYDYRVIVVAYDWYGTPQDVNVVGKVNSMYTKLYFKDA